MLFLSLYLLYFLLFAVHLWYSSSSVGRYLLCEVNVSNRSDLLLLDDWAVNGAVREAVASTYGDYGAALCSIRFYGKSWWGNVLISPPRIKYIH